MANTEHAEGLPVLQLRMGRRRFMGWGAKKAAAIAGLSVATGGLVGAVWRLANEPDEGEPGVKIVPAAAPETPQAVVPQATAAEVATPEVPQVVFWTMDQIKEAQADALAQGNLLLLDTWSEAGGITKEAKSYNDYPLLVIDHLGKQTFNSPVEGVVEAITTIGGPSDSSRDWSIYIQVGNREISVVADESNTLKVTNGQKVDINTPLFDLSGKMIGAGARYSQVGQVVIVGASYNTNTVDPMTAENILTDPGTNLPVRLASTEIDPRGLK